MNIIIHARDAGRVIIPVGDDYHSGDHEHHPRDSGQDLSLSSVFYTHFKCPVRSGLTRERCVVMINFIAAGDAGGFGVRVIIVMITVDDCHHCC